MGKKDEKQPPDIELNAIAEGLAAIHRGDVDGGAAALRFAQGIQEERDKKSEEKDRK